MEGLEIPKEITKKVTCGAEEIEEKVWDSDILRQQVLKIKDVNYTIPFYR